jgi:cellulose synthase/poly-beta-1,6-N-acetylglucosamine synthase-like glycosyltransferase
MISIIITSYKEPETIGKAIESILRNKPENYEILVTAPDKETLDAARKYNIKKRNIRLIQDKGIGKSAALNLAVSKARGEILILTDGDVFVDNGALKPLLEPFDDPKIGAVSGNPVSTNTKEDKFSFWAYVLTKIADKRRKNALKLKKKFFCSGYLFAIRKIIFPKLPEELLSEDGFISNEVYRKRKSIGYSGKARVYVKYPDNFQDWIAQKKRSAGGYNQIKKLTGIEMRSFKKESFGAFSLLEYVSNLREFFWLLSLFFARVYLWILIYRDINIKKKKHKEIWKRVESTK